MRLMKLTKPLSTFTVILVSTFTLFAQSPKIVWKNLQSNYKRFQDIKPVLRNESNQPVYFDCSESNYGSFPQYSYNETFKFLRNGDYGWGWNVLGCGTISLKELKETKKQKQQNEKLKKQGKYIPKGCRLDPHQEYTIRISDELWRYIIDGEGAAVYAYDSGNYKFTLEYEWANAPNPVISDSPEFVVKLVKD